MAASKEDITSWFTAGMKKGATHMIVVCDGFDYEDFPVYVEQGQDPRKVAEEYRSREGGGYRVMECYAMHLPFFGQLAEHRAFHWEGKE